MKYLHKIETRERDLTIATPQTAVAGLQVIVGTAPVNMTDDPAATVNTPIVCETFDEAERKLGFLEDYKNYTLCEAMDASFRKFGVSPVIFINVLDPAKHKTTMPAESGTAQDGVFVVKKTGILKSSVVVSGASGALTLDTDYVLDFTEEGYLSISFLTAQTTVSVTADMLNPAAVTEDDIIGGFHAESGTESGLEVVRQIYPKTGYVFGMLVCPKWSQKKKVAAVMAAKTEDVNGLFNAIAVIDLDTETCKKYTDVKKAKEQLGVSDKNAVIVWPCVKYKNSVYDYSVVWAAHAALLDAENGDVPYKSPSNKPIGVSSTCLADGKEIYLDNTQAAFVNSCGVVTAVNDQGWKSWGNENAGFPEVTSVKDRYISNRRMMNWYRNRFVLAYKDRVDDPASRRTVEAFVDSENQYLNSLASGGYIPAGCKIGYDEKVNTTEAIMNGDVVFDTQLAFFPVAKHIVNRISFNPQLITDALSGGEK